MANPFFVQPAQYGQSLSGLAGSVQQFGQQRQEEQRRQEAEAYKQEAKQAMATAFQSGDPMAIRQAVIQYPEIAETATQMFGFTNEQTEKVARETYRRALSETDPARRAAIMEGGIETVRQFGGNPRNMARDLEMLRTNPEGFDRSARAGYAALASDQEFEAMFPDASGSGLPAGVREFDSMVKAAGLKPGSEEYAQAALVNLGLEPRAGISAKERIAQDPELQSRVASLEKETQAAKEEGKLETQKALLPQIRANVKEAEQAAESRGEAISEYERAKASLPGVREVVDKLAVLSDEATYTLMGKAWDESVKQLGFGATEGATARANITALVDNQVLPLLRETFGAAFTAAEGDRLRATLLDEDAAPATKKAQLNAFIEQKMRDLETKRQRAGVSEQAQGGIMSMSRQQLNAMNPAEMSPEELEQAAARYEQLGAQ